MERICIAQEIVPYKKLIVTDYFSDQKGEMLEPSAYGMDPNFPKESTVTVLFEETQVGRAKLSIIYTAPAKKEQMEAMLKSGMKEGWNSSLDKLERVLAVTGTRRQRRSLWTNVRKKN